MILGMIWIYLLDVGNLSNNRLETIEFQERY